MIMIERKGHTYLRTCFCVDCERTREILARFRALLPGGKPEAPAEETTP